MAVPCYSAFDRPFVGLRDAALRACTRRFVGWGWIKMPPV